MSGQPAGFTTRPWHCSSVHRPCHLVDGGRSRFIGHAFSPFALLRDMLQGTCFAFVILPNSIGVGNFGALGRPSCVKHDQLIVAAMWNGLRRPGDVFSFAWLGSRLPGVHSLKTPGRQSLIRGRHLHTLLTALRWALGSILKSGISWVPMQPERTVSGLYAVPANAKTARGRYSPRFRSNQLDSARPGRESGLYQSPYRPLEL